MNKEISNFDDIETEMCKNRYSKYPTHIKYLDINQIMIPNKICFSRKGYKYFIDYKDDYDRTISLCISLTKQSGYAKKNYETKYMFLLLMMTNSQKYVLKSRRKSVTVLIRN